MAKWLFRASVWLLGSVATRPSKRVMDGVHIDLMDMCRLLPFACCLCWYKLFLAKCCERWGAQVKITDWWLILVDKIFITCTSPYQILYHHWAKTSETCFQLNHCYSRSLAQNWGSPPSCHSQTSSSLGTKLLATSCGLCFIVFVLSGAPYEVVSH